MHYPTFFDDVPTVTLRDPLSELLGAFDKGIITYSYTDAVKLAGHSCPTVAGAYLMASKGLSALYRAALPVRGEIRVTFKASLEEGASGVVANVISLITGATQRSGFKGLQGKFVRHSLMYFNGKIDADARFERVDNGSYVDLFYHPEQIQTDPRMMPLMGKLLSEKGSDEEKKLFASLWQERVKAILIDGFEDTKLLRISY